jgi:hypothetical protein
MEKNVHLSPKVYGQYERDIPELLDPSQFPANA